MFGSAVTFVVALWERTPTIAIAAATSIRIVERPMQIKPITVKRSAVYLNEGNIGVVVVVVGGGSVCFWRRCCDSRSGDSRCCGGGCHCSSRKRIGTIVFVPWSCTFHVRTEEEEKLMNLNGYYFI